MSDSSFSSDIARIYERDLVPLIFEPYAELMAERVSELMPRSVLEIAAGTGVATRALSRSLGADVTIVATDLNQTMLDQAAAKGTSHPVTWRQADALALPFSDESFDAVVCQFGMMFFPDKRRAFTEASRVLRSGGTYIFSVWDRIEENEFADAVTMALVARYPDYPPLFLSRTPHGYFETSGFLGELRALGFRDVGVETVAARSAATSALVPAVAYCQGTPLRGELEARGEKALEEATAAAARAIRERFGTGVVDAKIQGHIIRATKP